MARDFWINGESMVSVKGRSDSAIPGLTQLGLAQGPIAVQFNFYHKPIMVDAWGNELVPVDVQTFLSDAQITVNLIHFDEAVLETCWQLARAGGTTPGTMGHAGQRMGNGLPRFAPGGAGGNHYVGFNIASPVAPHNWRFLYCYITGQNNFPLGSEKSVVQTTWKAVPYTIDPWNGGLGAFGSPLYDYTLDT